ncbi:MAG: hypothetical protein GTO46_04755 [Gemmatimonadetes bacterium]|nr:hypothetical protein [Gemmatimonadota bacterium]NIO31015.1 hypothetical protein [Gemmatimonadota bacterium]
MRKAVVLLALVLSTGLFAGCDDGGPSGVTLADLVGSWIGDEFEFTNQANPAESVDLVAAGAVVTMTVASNGRYTIGAADPLGSGADFIKGAMLVEEGFLLATNDDEPGETAAFSVQLTANRLTIFTDEVDYDFDVPPDGINEPADLLAVFEFATGLTAADLAGTWEATEFRFVSTPTPTDTIDVIAQGGGLSVTVAADASYELTLMLPGEVPEIQSGVALLFGDMIVMIDEVSPEGSIRFEYGLAGQTITLRGEDSIDFNDPPDGVDEPAVVELVMELQ